MESSKSNKNAPPAIWEYVSLGDYAIPSDTVEQKIRSGIGALWKKIAAREPPREEPVHAEDDLQKLSSAQLGAIAPMPRWHAAAEALDTRLETWLADESPARPVVFLVSPPHSYREDILLVWAKRRGWRVLDPPGPNTVLTQDGRWIRDKFGGPLPWVFPRLDHCYLRHAHGLGLVRRLLDDMSAGNLGRGIVGCDSWAWTYLMKIWHGRHAEVLTTQAFDQGRMERWFGNLSAGVGRRRLDFRKTLDAQYVLPPVAETDEDDAASPRMSSFLTHLAAHARGIPGVALAFWRNSLRRGPEQPDAGDEGETENVWHPTAPSTIWVPPWDAVQKPEPPTEKDRDLAFVTHSLLLHSGMAVDILAETLPCSMSRIMKALSLLAEAGTAAEIEGIWRITARGYPAARQFLSLEGYLTDGF